MAAKEAAEWLKSSSRGGVGGLYVLFAVNPAKEEKDEKEKLENEGTLMQRHAIDFAEGSFFC